MTSTADETSRNRPTGPSRNRASRAFLGTRTFISLFFSRTFLILARRAGALTHTRAGVEMQIDGVNGKVDANHVANVDAQRLAGSLHLHVLCLHGKFKTGGLFDHPGTQKVVGFFTIFHALCNTFHILLQLVVADVVRGQPYGEESEAGENAYAGRQAPSRRPRRDGFQSLIFIRRTSRRAKLLPHIGVGSPLRVLETRNLQFSLGQRAVSIRANVLDARPPQQQHAAPRAGLHRHPQPPQAYPAAVPLVQNTEVKRSAAEQEPQPHDQRVRQIGAEAGAR